MKRKLLSICAAALLATAALAQGALPTVDAEVRKVDLDTKITLKHGDSKNLDMTGMTMVFRVKDEALLQMVKAADKVDGVLTVMSMEVDEGKR